MKLARLAGRSHGVVVRRDLLAVGITGKEIDHRLHSGALIAVFRSVYRVGHKAPSMTALYTAAVKACGPRALLCGLAAAHLLGLVKGKAPAPEVIGPTQRRVAGVKTRRGRRAGTAWLGIPVTTVAETMVDLAGVLSSEELARAFHEAGVRHHATPTQVEAALAARPMARGAGALRRVLRGDTPATLSKLERYFIALLRKDGLELPETNRPAGSKRVDCRWPAHNLTVELDSYRYHNSRHAWEQDRRREREAYARGDTFRRYTWTDVFEQPTSMLTELRKLLTAAQPKTQTARSASA